MDNKEETIKNLNDLREYCEDGLEESQETFWQPSVRAIDVAVSAIEENEKLKKENEDLFFTLTGVMHFVDKWLEGDELELDELNRAVRMRDKTLKIVEDLQTKVEDLEYHINN